MLALYPNKPWGYSREAQMLVLKQEKPAEAGFFVY
jgi:hypothetical protein